MFGRRRKKVTSARVARLGFESLESRQLMTASPFGMDDDVAVVQPRTEVVAPAEIPIAALLTVEEWVQSLTYTQFSQIAPNQVVYMTTAQVASIPSASYLASIPAASRAAFSTAQLRALNIGAVGISQLNANQISVLTASQIQQVKFWEFGLLPATQAPNLSVAQIASIPTSANFAELSPAARAALTTTQVRALNIAGVGINQLTSAQVSLLTPTQVQQVKFWEFGQLPASQIPNLSAAQIASIPARSNLAAIAPAARAMLSATQVRALNISGVGLGLLTATQIAALTAPQIQQVVYWEFELLAPGQIPYLTTAQIASIPGLASFATLSAASRNSLTATQVRALNIDVVGIGLLNTPQIAALTVAQIQQVKFWEFTYLAPSQIPSLTETQVASIPGLSSFATLSAASRNYLTAVQVRALNIDTIGIGMLNAPQIAALSAAQIRQVKFWEFGLLTEDQVPDLSAAQMSSIASLSNMAVIPAATRGAFTAAQVRALNIGAVGVSLLNSSQIAALTAPQIQQVKNWEFKFLPPSQIPNLTTAQIASISLASYLADMSAAARAALTATQVRALNIDVVGVSWLTAPQVAALTATQVQQVKYWEFKFLPPSQVALLTTTQIASIPTTSNLAEMPAESRAALTTIQLRALNVNSVGLSQLTASQIGQLTAAQVRQVKFWEFELLNASQIPLLTTTQIRSVITGAIFRTMPDALRRALTREQILSMSPDQIVGLTGPESEQTPPANYVPVVDRRNLGNTHSHESMKFYNLVPLASATHVAIASGSWSDSRIWRNGQVPSAGADVLVPAGVTVVFDSFMNVAIDTLRIDGTLSFAVDRNTQLKADTIVVYETGRLHIGTEANPIRDNVSARIVIPDGGPIDRVWDPYGLSRGLMSAGEVRMFGKTVTPYMALAVDPMAGDTVLQLSSAPTNWKVGDQLVISGTNAYVSDAGADRVTIRAINGNRVTVDRLIYDHDAPDGMGLSVSVANLSRNIVFVSEETSNAAERPHMVFFESPNVQIKNIAVNGFGRTDKSIPINDPIVINGKLQPGTGTNPRARYSLHFHHTGVDPLIAPATVSGSVVNGSPGWGYVNHQSNVIFTENVAFNVLGASFVTEDGNEIGQFVRNLSLNSTGASGDSMHSRRANHDFAFNGHGFWMQGAGVELIGNIASGSALSGYTYYTASSKAQFDVVNLTEEELGGGNKAVPVGVVPIKRFENNVSFASQAGLDVWYHQLNMNDGGSLINNFTSWNTVHVGVSVNYSGQIEIRGAKLVGHPTAFLGTGIAANIFSHDLVITNLNATGFAVGIDAPVRGATVINGASIAAVQGILIKKGHDTVRTVTMIGQIGFASLTPAQLQGRTAWKINMTEMYQFQLLTGRRYDSYLAADQIIWAPFGSTAQRLYFTEQLRWLVPFPAATARGYVPDQYLDKTNFQLMSQYGVASGGVLLNGSETTIAGIRGYATNM